MIIATCGLPGSGKSTWARQQQVMDNSLVLVSKDELRLMLHSGVWTQGNERVTENARDAIIEAALYKQRAVIVHDTNLHPKHLDRLAALAENCCVNFKIQSFLDVPVEECIRRDALRSGTAHVGDAVILRMVKDQLSGDKKELLLAMINDYNRLAP